VKQKKASLLASTLSVTALFMGVAPAAAQAPAAPTIMINGEPAATVRSADEPPPAAQKSKSAVVPAATAGAAGPAQAAPVSTPKKPTEVLPWADKPLVATSAVPTTGDVAAVEAAAAQCSGSFEAACRDLKTCAWIADIVLQDGTQVPARCVARPPAPPKKSATKKKPAPVKNAAAESTPAVAPAVKSSVTRVKEEAADPKPERKVEETSAIVKEPEPEAEAKPKPKPAPVAEKVEEAEKSKEPVKQAASNKPIVITPPAASSQPAAKSQMPSFGSISPIMPGGDNAVVVTVPRSSE
jgi:hypothetical protein